MNIGGRTIGPGNPCLLVAEIGLAHDGSLGTAMAYIDAVAAAGADAVKFQTHLADAESTPDEPFRVRFSPQDETRQDYWRRTQFDQQQWELLANHAAGRGLMFLSSPFSVQAVELLQQIGVPAWKVGAGEVTNLQILETIAATGMPVILSTGMSSWADLDAAVKCLRDRGAEVVLLQCTTAYPCPPEKLGLNVLAQLRDRFGCPVGLSDHSGCIYAGLAAKTLGADLIEVHVTLSRQCFGPDVPASLTIDELAQLVEGIRFIETALGSPVDKDAMAVDMAELRRTFGKSIVAARDLPAGTLLTPSDLAFKKPGTGIPAAEWETVLGRTLRKPVTADTLLSKHDFQ